jgi:hypothetical protein
MAAYKVIQDVEAEDKLVGPLSLRQFIYAMVSAGFMYLCFLAATKHAPALLVVFVPIAGGSGFFAFPWKGDQPTETWALAKLRFLVKPRRRIWNQTGMKHLVTVTAPKKVEVKYTNGLSQDQVQGRLSALADTIDSRGWATRNVDYTQLRQGYNPQDPFGLEDSDRLVNGSGTPEEVSDDSADGTDMLDDNSSVAQNFDSMLGRSSQDHRQRIVEQMTASRQQTKDNTLAADKKEPPQTQASASTNTTDPDNPTLPPVDLPDVPNNDVANMQVPSAQQGQSQVNNYWFLNDPAAGGQQSQVVAPGSQPDDAATSADEPTAAEQALSDKLKSENQASQEVNYAHVRVVQPLSPQHQVAQADDDQSQPASDSGDDAKSTPVTDKSDAKAGSNDHTKTDDTDKPARKASVTHHPDPAILELANNDDLDVATIARQANREIRKSPDEVEIQLH